MLLRRRSFLLGWFPPLFRKRQFESFAGIQFHIVRRGHGPRRYVFLHGNEPDARSLLESHMENTVGIAYLVTGPDRNVLVKGLRLDPNRMFSQAGAYANLQSLNPDAYESAIVNSLDAVGRSREKLLKLLTPPAGSRLVALHNNREYSVQDEISASDATSIKQPELPGDFFLCTDPKDFDVLRTSPYNVVLQSKPDPDDGSLSRLAARRGFRYINLECSLGQGSAQRERLQWLEDHLAG